MVQTAPSSADDTGGRHPNTWRRNNTLCNRGDGDAAAARPERCAGVSFAAMTRRVGALVYRHHMKRKRTQRMPIVLCDLLQLQARRPRNQR